MTARDLITRSMRLIGVLESGEVPDANEASDALASLNSLVDEWRTDRLMVYAVLPTQFDWKPGQKVYQLGPGGDWEMERPVRIEKVQFTYTGTGAGVPLNLPIEILDIDQYNQLIVPDTASQIPSGVYIDNNFPLRSLYFYTVPTANYAVTLYTWQQLTGFADLDAEVNLPPGYEKALRFNLAIDLAPEYGAEPSATVVTRAMEAKAAVQSSNNTYTPLLRCEDGTTDDDGAFNYLTGGFGRNR